MALFAKADPTKSLARDLEAATAMLDKLRASLNQAELATTDAREKVDRLGSDNADSRALVSGHAVLRDCEAVEATRRGSLAKKDDEVAALKSKLADAVDLKTRAETVVEVGAMKNELISAAQQLDPAIARMLNISEACSGFIPEAQGLRAFCSSSKTQIPDAAALILKLLGYHADSVAGGTAPATLRKPAPVAKFINPTPSATTVRLFAAKGVKWNDANGHQKLAAQFTDCELTPSAAVYALSVKACVKLDDPIRKTNAGWTTGHPRAEHCLDLDAAEPAGNGNCIEPIMQSSPFTVVDRGGPIQVKVARS